MAFGNNQDKIQIVVEVDNTGAIKLLNDTEQAVKKVGKESNVAQTNSNDFFVSFVKGATGAAASAFTFQKAIEGIKFGSQVDDLNQAFNVLARSAGIASNALLNDLRKATAGTISDFELMKEANQNMLAGLDPSKFATTIEQTRKLAEATGVDLKEAYNLVNDALITGNDRALKKRLGLNADIAASERELKKAYGDNNIELTEAAKVGAAQAAIYDALSAKTSGLATVTDDAADLIDQMQVSILNAKNQAIKKIATDNALKGALKGIKEGIENIDWGAFITGAFNATNAAINFTERGILSLLATIENVQNFIKDPSFKTATQDVLRDIAKPLDEEMNKIVDILNKGTPQAIDQARQKFVELEQTIQKQSRAVQIALLPAYRELAKNFPEVAESGEKVSDSSKTQTERAAQLKTALEQLRSQLGINGIVKSQKEAAKATEKHTSAIDKQIALLNEELELVKKQIALNEESQKLSEEQEKARRERFNKQKEEGILGSLLGNMTGGQDISSMLSDNPNMQAGFEAAGSQAASAFMDGLTRALNGETLTGEDYGSYIGSSLGAGIGAYLGGPAGAQIGAMIGDKLGSSIAEELSGDSQGTKIKKALDKVFADAYKDLEFSGNQDPTKGPFANLAVQSQQLYQTIGDAITVTLGQSTESGVNLGVVLANNNVTLAEMQSIIGELGLSFDQLAESILDAFYQGELSITELQVKLEELYGVANGTAAFDNLGDAVSHALDQETKGRDLLGTLKAVFAIAQSQGITTFQQLANVLSSSFGMSAQNVKALIDSIVASGAKGISDLVNFSNTQLASVGANIQAVQNGQAPTFQAVGFKQSSTSSAPSRGSSSSNSRQPTAEQKADKERQELLRILNQVENSKTGKELQSKIQDGLINDDQYAKGIDSLIQQAKKLQKSIEKEQKEYLDAVRKGSKKQAQELKELKKAEGELDKILGDKEDRNSFSINSPLLDFMKEFTGRIDLLNEAVLAAGGSFANLQKAAENAFLSGKQTFAEAKKAIDELNGGNSPKAQLEKFKALGNKGGQLSVSAFKDIGKSIKNAGGTSLDNLSESFIGSGAAPEDVQKFFIALTNTGITSLDAIENASAETVIRVGSQLEDLGFSFAQTQSETSKILSQLDEIRNSKIKTTINISLDISDADRKLLESAGIVPAGFGQSESQPTPYAGTSPGLPTATKSRQTYKNTRVGYGLYRDKNGKLTSQSYSYF